ncbi:MAG: hypothetical protein OHK005_07170 [Candidatus Methylacidiphilales bacterium]
MEPQARSSQGIGAENTVGENRVYCNFKDVKSYNAVLSVALISLLLPLGPASAEEVPAQVWKRLDGITYEQPKIRRIEDGKIVLQHKTGFATVPAGYFSDDDLKSMGLDPADFPELSSQREEVAMRVNLYALKKTVPSFQITQGIFENIKTAEIEDIDPVTILVVTNGVPRRIPLETLPKDIQQRLGYDPDKAAAYEAAREQARQAGLSEFAKQQEAEAKRQAALEKARAAEAKKAQTAKTSSQKTNSLFEKSKMEVFEKKK